MKLLNAMFSTTYGGVEQVFLDYHQALSNLGHECIQIIHPWAAIKNQCPKQNTRSVFSYGSKDALAAWRLRRLVQKEQPDAIITHTRRAAQLFARSNTATPRIAVCHDPQLFPLLLKTSYAIVTVTESMREQLLAKHPTPKPVVAIPNMIQLPQGLLYSAPAHKPVPTIGVLSRFSHEKGIHVFIEALGLLKSQGILFKAHIGGDGSLKSQYLKRIRELNLQEEVHLLGWVHDKNAYYQAIDIFCLPSFIESFGLVVLESMMHSKPMVLTEVSGPVEIIGNSQAALMVPPNDAAALAEGLKRMLTQPDLAQHCSERAFARLFDFSSEVAGQKMDALLRSVIHAR